MKPPGWLTKISPLSIRLSNYRREFFAGDLIAGLVVAIMLIPQAMAYAMLAGLPPEVGLYASILPLLLYSVLGTSNALAVGPVAMVSLLVVSGVGELAAPGSPEFISLCLTLALLVGALQILMAAFRMGFLVNFISHPVLTGFTSAAAVVIAVSQLKHLMGVSIPGGTQPWQMMVNTVGRADEFNPATLVIGLASCGLLLLFAWAVSPLLQRSGIKKTVADVLARTGPLVVVAAAALVVGWMSLHTSRTVAIVGDIPAGLPNVTIPRVGWATVRSLLPLAVVIALVGYLESYSVAKALASRRRERIDPDRELLALGVADLGAAFTGGYPVTGGFSRSLVNYSAGVRTSLGSVITAILVAVSVTFLTPLFFFIPKAVLAGIIVVAVTGLIDFRAPFQLWKQNPADAMAFGITFLSVLGLGIETGILIGIGATVVMLMWKTSRPHIAEVGRVADSEHFRNVLRHPVQGCPGLLAVRIDESLNFANARFVEMWILEHVSKRKSIRDVLIIGSGINDVDATGIEVIATMRDELEIAGVDLWLSDVKGPVMDKLERSRLDPEFLNQHVFLSAHQALGRLRPAIPPSMSAADTDRSGTRSPVDSGHCPESGKVLSPGDAEPQSAGVPVESPALSRPNQEYRSDE